MKTTPIICVGGENLIDHVTRGDVVTALPGGSPFNVAMALGRQDADIRYVTPISNDHWGDSLADTLTTSNVVLGGGRSDKPTTMARVTLVDGIPSYNFERDDTAERAVTEASLAASIPEETAALHTGSLAVSEGEDGAAWEATCATAFATEKLVSYDPNLRLSVVKDPDSYRTRVFRMMGKTTLLKLSDEDLEGLCPGKPQSEALQTIQENSSAALLVMTKGPEGAVAWSKDGQIDLPAPPVPDLVDTVGAGDTLMATLLTGLSRIDALSPDAMQKLDRVQIEGLLRRAGMAAAINCARAGCNPPTRAELDAALK